MDQRVGKLNIKKEGYHFLRQVFYTWRDCFMGYLKASFSFEFDKNIRQKSGPCKILKQIKMPDKKKARLNFSNLTIWAKNSEEFGPLIFIKRENNNH